MVAVQITSYTCPKDNLPNNLLRKSSCDVYDGLNSSETFHLQHASHPSLLIKTVTINKTGPEEIIIRVVVLLNKEIKFQ